VGQHADLLHARLRCQYVNDLVGALAETHRCGLSPKVSAQGPVRRQLLHCRK
jgi:hypothetical protein